MSTRFSVGEKFVGGRNRIMFFVALAGMQGYDTVVYSSISGYRAGDLLEDSGGFFLCIGKNIEFGALYKKQKAKEYSFINPTKIYKQLLSQQTIDVIHWMVKHYFSSYKHVVALFIPTGLENRIPKKPIKIQECKQECIIFPDLRTLTQTYPINTIEPDTAILHGGMTQLQKAKVFRGIKSGEIKRLLATNRGLFFDWSNITNITIYNPSNWAYSGQSEPRFVIKEVGEKVSEIYNATIQYK